MASSAIPAKRPRRRSWFDRLKSWFVAWFVKVGFPGICLQFLLWTLGTTASFLVAALLTRDNYGLIIMGFVGAVVMLAVVAVSARPQAPGWMALALTMVAGVTSAALLVWLAFFNTVPPITVSIATPAEGAKVKHEIRVTGTVADPDATVFVIIRPHKSPTFWPQSTTFVSSAGAGASGAGANWSGQAWVGTTSLGNNESFDVIAIATNENWLSAVLAGRSFETGDTFTSMPKGLSRNMASVTVTRQD